MKTSHSALLLALTLPLLLTASEDQPVYIVAPASLPATPYAEWAHYHWVWLSNDRANQDSMTEYAADYLAHDIKVGAVDIDSGWSTGFNNFEFDVKKYPNATKMVEFFHSKGIRVILWATSVINTDSSNYKEAHDNGYLIRNIVGHQSTFSWWHGKGGLLDYSNEEAKKWWHKQMDKVLDIGIDGWKCDGTDPYILELIVPLGKHGVVSRKEYSDSYYADFFDYTRQKLGSDRLIMSRPVDGFGPIFLHFSPKKVMYSGWVGDDDPTFQGLQSALKSYLQSAWAGYANFGSDIGGYRSGSGKLGRTKELFIRWSQLGAFSPLMENGGNKEHRPWKFDSYNETLNIYRKFVDVHYQLVPYLLTTGSNAMENKTSSITPLAHHDNFIQKLVDDFSPSTYNYLLGKSILVAPIVTNDSSSDFSVSFPQGPNWVYWWNHSMWYHGGSTVKFKKFPLDEFPVFFINGSFIPLRVTDQTVLPGYPKRKSSAELFTGYLRWILHSPSSVTHKPVSFSVREEQGPGITASYWWSSSDCMVIQITAHVSQQSLIQVTGIPTPPRTVTIQGIEGALRTASVVGSHIRLKQRDGAYLKHYEGGYYTLLIHPSINSGLGHCVHVCF